MGLPPMARQGDLYSCMMVGFHGLCRFGRHISAKGSHAAVMSSYPPRSASILFFLALRERTRARQAGDERAEIRAWKLFGLIPMMLLHKPQGSGSVGRDQLAHRADEFARGHWDSLLRAARQNLFNRSQHRELSEDEERIRRGVVAQRRKPGRLRQARHWHHGMNTHVSNCRTGDLSVKCRRTSRRSWSSILAAHSTLDPHIFAKCLRSAPSGSDPGPGGCSYQMLKTCLDDAELLQLLTEAAEDFARAAVPQCIFHAFRQATMTALMKPDGGIRGIATSTSFRRLVFGSAVHERCRGCVFTVPVCPFHSGGNRLRGARCESPH